MGAYVKKLQLHLDDRGYLYEILRSDDDCFDGFGQYYVSVTNTGVVKGFHRHFKQKDYVTCVYGQIKLVLIDERSEVAEIEVFHLSPLDPKMVIIDPLVYHG